MSIIESVTHSQCKTLYSYDSRMPFPTQHFVMFNMLYCKEINETFLNLSFDGGLKLCFFDWGEGVDSIHLFLLMKTIEKVDLLFLFLHDKI